MLQILQNPVKRRKIKIRLGKHAAMSSLFQDNGYESASQIDIKKRFSSDYSISH